MNLLYSWKELDLSIRVIVMIINLMYIAKFNGILTALYLVVKYIQTQNMHTWIYMKQLCLYTYTCEHIYIR